MKYDIDGYRLMKIYTTGTDMKLFLVHPSKPNTTVLEMNKVAGFFLFNYAEKEMSIQNLSCIRIDEVGGSYNLDLSMRLNSPEIANYQEAFIFTDPKCVNFVFRVAAKHIKYREINNNDNWFTGSQ